MGEITREKRIIFFTRRQPMGARHFARQIQICFSLLNFSTGFVQSPTF